MQSQHLVKGDKQRVIDNRIAVSTEIFASILSKTNNMLKSRFQENSTIWHDKDRDRAVDVAKLIFSRAVDFEDVKEMAKQVHTPDIEDVKITEDNGDGKTGALDPEIGSF